MHKLLICDDNKNTVNELHAMIEEFYPGVFDHAFAYKIADIAEDSFYDVLIMDIDLIDSDGTNSSGIELAAKLKCSNPEIQIIFASAFHEYAQDIFEVEPVYYLQKPVKSDKLRAAVDKAISSIEKLERSKFSFSSGAQIVSVPYSDILYYESDKRLMKLHTVNNVYSFYSRIKDVEAKLDDSFVKTHQSFIVNLKHVERLRSDTAVLDTGAAIPVSQARAKEVRIALTRYLGGMLA